MAKTNFSKAEEAMSEALQKMTVQQWLQLADAHAGTADDLFKKTRARALLVTTLKLELKRLHKLDAETYKKLGVKRNQLETWLGDPAKITDDEWTKIVELKAKASDYIKMLGGKELSNEQLVEGQRTKHINKRFNVNDKWLPLK